MPDLTLVPAWTSMFLGLFAFFAGVGELRNPGQWDKVLRDIVASPSLQLITALVELFLGAVIYLANPWESADWLSSFLNVLGGLMVLEALVILAFSDFYIAFWLRRFGPLSRLWALFSMIVGVALVALALTRF